MSDAPNNPETILCSLCGEQVPVVHKCSKVISSLIHDVVSLSSVVENKMGNLTFQNIDNLVFQGGGVKGVAYLGVLQELEEKHPQVLRNIKRVAGTSAGSMLALYLGLNMNFNQMRALVYEKSLSDTLDEDIQIRVCTNPEDNPLNYKFENHKVKDIFSGALEAIKAIYKASRSKNPLTKNWAKQEINIILVNILRYHNLLTGWKATAVKYMPRTFYQFGIGAKIIEQLREYESILVDEPDEPGEPNESSEDATSPAKPVLEGEKLHFALAKLLGATLFSTVDDSFKKYVNLSNQNETSGEEAKIDQASLFTGRVVKEQLIEAPIRTQLQYLVEMTKNTEGGDPIPFDIDNPPFDLDAPTFGDLASCLDAHGRPCFRDFYVTAFNTRTLQTEVFSAEHTPNVVAADAVRASMSIPVFFSSATIREKTVKEKGSLEEPKLIYKEIEYHNDEGEKGKEEVRYMDGGVFDNYAMWIFDDLKYCWPIGLRWHARNQRVHIDNPRTLGFKITDEEILIKSDGIPKEDLLKDKIGTSRKILKFLLGSIVGGFEENVYSRDGQWSRTICLSNCGVSTFAFQMNRVWKDKLVDSGRRSVRKYLDEIREKAPAEKSKRYSISSLVR